MTIRTAYVRWDDDLRFGSGSVSIEADCGGRLDFTSRVRGTGGLTPEGLIGGGLAACFSMAFAQALAGAGHRTQRVETEAEVAFERQGGTYAITRIVLSVVVDAEEIDEAEIGHVAEETKRACSVARALSGVTIDHTLWIRSGADRMMATSGANDLP